MRQNPYPVLDAAGKTTGWKWLNEESYPSPKTYATQRAALRDLLDYLDWLEGGPTLWQRVWWPIRYKLWPKVMEFIYS